ncbi:MAG: YcxB family protein [Terracidiphilus sp.]
MDFTYTFNRGVFLNAYRFAFWRPWRKVILAGLGAIALLEVCLLSLDVMDGIAKGDMVTGTLTREPADTSLVVLAAVVFIALAMLIGPWLRALLLYRRNPVQGATIHVSLTAERVEARIEGVGRSAFNWRYYSHWRESRHVFLVFLRAGGFQFLPKDCLSSEQQSELRTLLAGSLPKR